MRFLSAPWIGVLKSGAWLRNAEHANACAQRLVRQIEGLPEIELIFPVQANAVFLRMPEARLAALRALGWCFYTFIDGGARFMFAWDAQPERVDELARDIRRIVTAGTAPKQQTERPGPERRRHPTRTRTGAPQKVDLHRFAQFFGESPKAPAQRMLTVGPQAGRKVMTLQTCPPTKTRWAAIPERQAVSLSMRVWPRAGECARLERFCRYISRPAISKKRLSRAGACRAARGNELGRAAQAGIRG